MKGEYAGDKLVDIMQKEDEVVEAWKNLLERVRDRNNKLGQSDEYQRLIVMIQNLLLWIEDMRLKMESDDQPKYVSHFLICFCTFLYFIYSLAYSFIHLSIHSFMLSFIIKLLLNCSR